MEDEYAHAASMQAIKRPEVPADLVGTVSFLTSDDAAQCGRRPCPQLIARQRAPIRPTYTARHYLSPLSTITAALREQRVQPRRMITIDR